MDWTAGYASDVEYTAGFYLEQSPAYLNFVCILNGVEPIALDQPFTYFELGFGRGLTVNLLAAANPQGQFYAADFNPAHVAGARELASAAELKNLTLLEDSFEELANGKEQDLPQFDFITLHGIYTWVTTENQQHIIQFISRYLKPGGIVYLSYNAMPGWTAALPLQRLLVEYADAFPNRSNLQVKAAAEFVQRLESAGAGYFTTNPHLTPRLETLKNGNTNYLVHEYMHKHWAPRYHADIARDLADAKMDFVGSAELALAYPNLFLSEEKQALVQTISDSAMRETMKDYFINTGFRKDVFVRGSRRLSTVKQAEYLSQMAVLLLVPLKDANLKIKCPFGEVDGKPELFNPVIEAISVRPHTIAELQALPILQGQTQASLTQVVALLAASGQAVFYHPQNVKQSPENAKRMNRAVARMTHYGDDYQAMSSSLLGNGIVMGYIERILFSVVAENGALDQSAIAKQVWHVVKSHGRNMIKEGNVLQGEESNLEEISKQVGNILRLKMPLWQQLGLL